MGGIYNSYYSQTGQTSLDGFINATAGFPFPTFTPPDPRATEDCLFLDVMVPRKVFEGRSSKGKARKRRAAVLVWIHGGGYGAGSKYDSPPAGLLARSQMGAEEGVIFVAINYRLYDEFLPLDIETSTDTHQWCTWMALRPLICG